MGRNPNPFFSFKHFTVHQAGVGMKVTTDACLFGAWAAEAFSGMLRNPTGRPPASVLDIGTGTGLLSLMLAQRLAPFVAVDAIDIDDVAVAKAEQNFRDSPWSAHVRAQQANLLDLPNKGYRFIICNPPFYEGSLSSPDHKKNLAMHAQALTLSVLIEIVAALIGEEGVFALLLPAFREQEAVALAVKAAMHVWRTTLVRRSAAHPYSRCMILLGKSPNPQPVADDILLFEGPDYSERFRKLLKDYYLAF